MWVSLHDEYGNTISGRVNTFNQAIDRLERFADNQDTSNVISQDCEVLVGSVSMVRRKESGRSYFGTVTNEDTGETIPQDDVKA